MDGGQRNQRREDRQKLQKNSKNTETDRKVIQQNTKTKIGMKEVGDKEKGHGLQV
jgi:hypothetical protein